MLSQLKKGNRVVGLKQTRKALSARRARCVFLAEDADPAVTDALAGQCRAEEIPCVMVPSMKELGTACGIQVGAAAAALLAG